MKLKTLYICEKCSTTHTKWSGQCSSCGNWNSLIEDVQDISSAKQSVVHKTDAITPGETISFSSKQEGTTKRLETKMQELDRVLGGGFIHDSLTLLTGDPGIGKSTIALQIAKEFSEQKNHVLYISGEESSGQILSRAKRIGMKESEYFSLYNELILEKIIATILHNKPNCIIIDSIQVLYSSELPGMAGTINQIRFVTENLMQLAKEYGIMIILIGHVTKDGNMAGPMVLSHLVDTVLFLEGQKHSELRLLRGMKNRFGSTSEVGIFEMKEDGFHEVLNPSEAFLEGRNKNAIGSSVTSTLEGTRPFLIEVQALTTYTKFGYPKRTTSGYDMNRLHLMIAVLTKYAGMPLDSQDVFLNIVGGLKIQEPSCDLAICMAIASSKLQKPIPEDMVILGEIGLSGEIRSISHIEKRIKDAKKMGFKTLCIPKGNYKVEGVKLLQPTTVSESISLVL